MIAFSLMRACDVGTSSLANGRCVETDGEQDVVEIVDADEIMGLEDGYSEGGV